jgi:hypothetical protein
MKNFIPQEGIERKIYLIRGRKVMLSTHLAKLYDVKVKVLIQAVKRNIERFPEDFMFQLTWEEMQSSRSQIVTLNDIVKRGENIKYLPYVFTEQGVALELKYKNHDMRLSEYDKHIMAIFEAIKKLMAGAPGKAAAHNRF